MRSHDVTTSQCFLTKKVFPKHNHALYPIEEHKTHQKPASLVRDLIMGLDSFKFQQTTLVTHAVYTIT